MSIRSHIVPALDRQTDGRTDRQTDIIGKTISRFACNRLADAR